MNAYEDCMAATSTREAPWYIVPGNDKKRARLNCMDHLLSLIPYTDAPNTPVTLPERVFNPDYERDPIPFHRHILHAFRQAYRKPKLDSIGGQDQ